MAAYDSASVLDKALRLTGDDLTPAALNRAFSLLGQMESPRGIWAFNINRTPQQKWFLRRLRLDGQVAANMLDADLAVLELSRRGSAGGLCRRGSAGHREHRLAERRRHAVQRPRDAGPPPGRTPAAPGRWRACGPGPSPSRTRPVARPG